MSDSSTSENSLFRNKGARTLLGFAVSIAFGVGITGSLEDAFTFFGMTVICTAGLALLIWIPVFFAIGTVTFEVVGLFFPKAKNSIDSTPSPQNATVRERLAVVEYIQKGRAAGLTDTTISMDLRLAGWSSDLVKSAFDLLAQPITGSAHETCSDGG